MVGVFRGPKEAGFLGQFMRKPENFPEFVGILQANVRNNHELPRGDFRSYRL